MKKILILFAIILSGCSIIHPNDTLCQNTGLIILTQHDVDNLSSKALQAIYKHDMAYKTICLKK